MTEDSIKQANKRLLVRLLIVVVAMFGFGFALVPVYSVFCKITGLNGKTSNEVAKDTSGPIDDKRIVTVEFLASLNESAPWEFHPEIAKLKVHPGEFYHIAYYAKNLTDQPLVGQAIPSVAPGLAASHFQKIECFCFSKQDFKPGEGRDMPVTFRIDTALPAEITTVTLSYTFFKLNEVAHQD
ncbi:MAG: cytochrome c oxidase assembly protein [Gammaproteobacteria bacterium]|nr:cytochrome c oxidase assembly protein [Gammaproteobacteria bacterium]